MSILHTVNKSPFERNSLDRCLQMAKPGSAVLLIEDGVYGALQGTAAEAQVRKGIQDGGVKVFVLGPDLDARGMGEGAFIEGVESVDYGGFVDLCAAHDAVQSWL